MKTLKELIRFDWAMKKLLRDKANFDILEGFLSELLSENIIIKKILDSESNKSTNDDKHNRVDMLVENSKKELVIIEIQNSKEYDYFHRILFGTSKVITEHIKAGEAYSMVKKVISITIAYFDLGQGADYVYHGTTAFKGVHKGDVLQLALRQKEMYKRENVQDIFPEYWLIKVSKFHNKVQDKLDEWIFFFKNGTINNDFTAKGLLQAKTKLATLNLDEKQQLEYNAYLKYLHDQASEQHTLMADAEEKLQWAKKVAEAEEKVAEAEEKVAEAEEKVAEAEEKVAASEKKAEEAKQEAEEAKQEAAKKEIDAVIGLSQSNIPISVIAAALHIPEEKVKDIIKKHKN